MGLKQYQHWLSDIMAGADGPPYNFADKQQAVDQYVGYMLLRTQSMFTWTGLPETIPQRMLELMLQINGYAAVAPVNGSLYAFVGGLGGKRDVYYEPTIVTIANPALEYNASLRIGEECALVRNDALHAGLMPMYQRYAAQMAETDLSINLATISSRLITLIAAADDRTMAAAVKMLDDIKAGKLGVILSPSAFVDGNALRTLPYSTESSNGTIKNLIELLQYTRATWYNDLGLNANWNAKRESLSSSESLLNDDALLPLIDDMLRCRQAGADEINRLYGTEISVSFASSWEDNQIELENEQDLGAAEADAEAAAAEGGGSDASTGTPE